MLPRKKRYVRLDDPPNRNAMPQILGYELQNAVSEGRVSTYRATRKEDGENFLVKLATTEVATVQDFARLRNEYELILDLKVSGVLRAVDLASDSTGLLLVQEAFNGVPVAELLRRGRIDTSQFLDITIPLVRVVGELHSNGIVHQGICSRAVLVDLALGSTCY